MSEHDYDAIIDAMQFEVLENQAIEYPCSTPAVLDFVGQPKVDNVAFEDEIDEHHYVNINTNVNETEDGFFFSTKLLTDHMNELVIKADANSVRLFPKGDRIDVYEMSRIIHSIEDAFGSELEFNPDSE